MLIKPQLSFTYDCKYCNKPINGQVELFTLTTESYTCACDCGRSSLTASAVGSVLNIRYLCPICGEEHSDTAQFDALLGDKAYAFICPNTDVPGCFAGTPESIAYMDSAEADAEIEDFLEQLFGLMSEPEDKN